MPKRRKFDNAHDNLDLPDRVITLQRKQIQQDVDYGKKVLHRALKLARGFERQKLGRRQKTAKQKNDGAESKRLEAEVHALKVCRAC